MANEQHGPLSILSNTSATATTLYLALALTAGGLALPAAGGSIVGVNQTKAAVGKKCTVEHRPGARTRATSGGAVSFGQKLKVDAAGKFVTASDQDVADGKAVAWCYDGASGADKRISVVLLGNFGLASLAPQESIADDADHVVATSAYTDETLVTLGTTNMTGVLANGLFAGQKKRVRVIADSGGFTYVLTPTTMAAGQPPSFTMTKKGQMFDLQWTATGWEVIAVRTAGVATPAAASTLNLLCRLNVITINGSENRVVPNGWCPGHRVSAILGTATSGSTTLTGLYYDEDGSADGVTVTLDAANDQAHLEWEGARWLATTQVSAPIA